MLILGRQFGESFVIRGPGLTAPITIAVLGMKHGKIRIGIDAPRTMAIVREELIAKYDRMRIDAEDKEAANHENSKP